VNDRPTHWHARLGSDTEPEPQPPAEIVDLVTLSDSDKEDNDD
jgi:hypothetical protein